MLKSGPQWRHGYLTEKEAELIHSRRTDSYTDETAPLTLGVGLLLSYSEQVDLKVQPVKGAFMVDERVSILKSIYLP